MDRRKKISDLYKKAMNSGLDKAPGGPSGGEEPAAEDLAAFARGSTKKKEASPRGAKPAKKKNPPPSPIVFDAEAEPSRDVKAERAVPAVPGLLKLTGAKEASVRKAAKFLMLIGKDEAAKVMQHFTPEEAEAVAREIAGIRRIENAEAEKILTEFGLLRESLAVPAGGVDAARRILVNAFGEEKGREILLRCVPVEEEKFFGFLNDFQPQQLAFLLRNEPPAVLAVIVPYLQPQTASGLLPLLEKGFRAELVRRMAKMEKISRDVLARMEEALRERARRLSAPAAEEELDGKGVLAEILKYVDLSEEEKILKNIEDENPDIAREIKDRLFTIDVLNYMEDADLQKILRDMNDRDIALLLKGKNDGVRARILTNVSDRRRTFVADEYRVLGAVPRKDADSATRDFLNLLKRLEATGEITFHREGDVWVS